MSNADQEVSGRLGLSADRAGGLRRRLAYSITQEVIESLEPKFWASVTVRAADECWEWDGRRDETGYGVLSLGKRNYRATRLSLAIAGTEVPQHLLVCHRCDNPPCVNPAHLFLGASADNAADRIAKGRRLQRKGELNPRAKLTAALVAEIRTSPLSARRLAKSLGVGRTTIRDARSGRRWGGEL